jgi:hypothetical protein
MPWMRFTADHDHRLGSKAMLAYRAGEIRFLPRTIAAAAEACGNAVQIPRPEGVLVTKSGRIIRASLKENSNG